ncbi:MAG: type II toxin-antitoxin system VapC family toxin [Nanoarchaeota archaeon]
MEREICLDSDIIIEILRNNEKVIKNVYSLDAIFHTTSINIFEIWSGRFEKEENQINGILRAFEKIDFEEKHAILAGDIQMKLRERKELIDFRDLFIASICICNNLELLTNNKKHFEKLKKFGLKLIE